MGLNSACIVGRLEDKPASRTTRDGTQLATFRLLIDVPPRNGVPSDPDWIDVEAWERAAHFAIEHLTRGDTTCVQGALRLERWTDQQGEKRSQMLLRAFRLDRLGASSEAQG